MYVHVKSDTDESRFIATWPGAGYFAPAEINGWVQFTNWDEKKTFTSLDKILTEASDHTIYEDETYYYFYDSSCPKVHQVLKTDIIDPVTSFPDYGKADKIVYWTDNNSYWHYVWKYEADVAGSIPTSYEYCWTKIERIITKDSLPTIGTIGALYHITTTDSYYYWDSWNKCWQYLSSAASVNETAWSSYTAKADFSEYVTINCVRDTDNKEYQLIYIPMKGYQLGWIRIYNWDSPRIMSYEYEVFKACNQHLVYKNVVDGKMYLYAAHKPGYQSVTATKVASLPSDPLEDIVYHRTDDDTYWYYCYNYNNIVPKASTQAIWRKPLYCKYVDFVEDLPLDGDLDMLACIVENADTPSVASYFCYDINTDQWVKLGWIDVNVSTIINSSPSTFDRIYNAEGTYQANPWHTYWIGTDVSKLQPSGDWVLLNNFTNPTAYVSLDAFINAAVNKNVAVLKTALSQKYLYKSYLPGTIAISNVVNVNYALPPDYGDPAVVYHRKADNTYWHFEFNWKAELFPPALTAQSWNKIRYNKFISVKVGEPQEYNLYTLDNIVYWVDPSVGDWLNMSEPGKQDNVPEKDWIAYTDNTKLYKVQAVRSGFTYDTYWTIKQGTKDTSNWVYISNFDTPETVENTLSIYDKANNHLLYKVGGVPSTGWIQIENYNEPIEQSIDTLGWISALPQDTMYIHTNGLRYANQGEYPGMYSYLAEVLGNVRDCDQLPVGNIFQGIYHRTSDDTYWTYCYDFSKSASYVPVPPSGYKWVHPTSMYFNSGGNFPIQGVEGVLYKSSNRRSVWYDNMYHAVATGSTRIRASQWETYNTPANAGKAFEIWIDRPADCEVASNYSVVWYLQPL